MPTQVFGKLVNPFTTRGADYAHHITTAPPPSNGWNFRRLCAIQFRTYSINTEDCYWERPLMTSDIRIGRGVQDSPQNRTL